MLMMQTEMGKLESRWEHNVIVRLIDRPLAELFVADLQEIGTLTFAGPFVDGNEVFVSSLQAPAVVHLRRLVLPALVDVQLVEWAHNRSELRIVPRSSHFELWSEHRRRRYFEVAHDAANQMVRVLMCAQVAA